jgi:hypothetical protein
LAFVLKQNLKNLHSTPNYEEHFISSLRYMFLRKELSDSKQQQILLFYQKLMRERPYVHLRQSIVDSIFAKYSGAPDMSQKCATIVFSILKRYISRLHDEQVLEISSEIFSLLSLRAERSLELFV